MLKLLQYALVVCLILGSGFEALAKPSRQQQVEMAALYLPVDLDVPMKWRHCGTWNAFYYFAHRIELCTDNLQEGVEIARSIYLHELGHAYTFSRGMSYERWEGNYEAAADEFSALMSILQGHPEDLLHMAALHLEWAEDHPHHPDDPHPSSEDRAKMFQTLYIGFHFPLSPQAKVWRDTLKFWHTQFRKEVP